MGNYITYDESVKWMRKQPQQEALVKLCYLDEDNLAAAKRFSVSEEFSAVKQLLNMHSKSEALKILDIGCGNGIASYAFASLGHNVIATDPDLSQDVGLGATERLSKLLQAGSISVVQASAEALPFEDGSFDIVYTRQALHHFSDLFQGVAECSRVLKSDGLFLASREHVVNNEKQLQDFLDNHILHQLHGGENAYRLYEYVSALKKAGFKRIKSIGPFESSINQYPLSNDDLKMFLANSLKQKLGKQFGSFLSTKWIVEKFYRWWLSYRGAPGRCYTFFCHK